MKAFFITIGLLALAAIVLAFSKRTFSPQIDRFPDEVYLKAPTSLNGSVAFKARVVSEMGREGNFGSFRLTAIETTSGQAIDLVIIIPDKVKPPQLLPGQMFQIMATAEKGNLLAVELIKI